MVAPEDPEFTNYESEETTEDEFFKGKRTWSIIKDEVIGKYITAYLTKLARRPEKIVIIDAFAGPGKFEDGKAGSPLLICQAAEKRAPDKCIAIFVNRKAEHHKQLQHVLANFISKKSAIPILGSAEDLLARISKEITTQTVFLYMDPFGLRGCEFSTIEPFLKRDPAYSTEIIINISVPIIHRLAAHKAHQEEKGATPRIVSFNKRLTKVLGGDYWKDIMWSSTLSPEAKIEQVISHYRERLKNYGFPYSGSCPVRESPDSQIKYFITFCSRHPDSMILMNDFMHDAYSNRMHRATTDGTLFAGTSWKNSNRLPRELCETIEAKIRDEPGISRDALWQAIVLTHFMRFRRPDFISAVKRLYQCGFIRFDDVRGTRRLNGDSRLYWSDK